MKLLIVSLLVTLAATPVVAADYAWIASGKNAVAALDISTIQRTGDRVRALVLTNAPVPNPTSIRSIAMLREFDCFEGRSRDLTTTGYDSNLEVVQTIAEKPWSYVTPGTAGEGILKWACSPGSIDPNSVTKDVSREGFAARAEAILSRGN